MTLGRIFGHTGTNASNVIYANWFSNGLRGVNALSMYSPTSQEWKEAHARARYILLQVNESAHKRPSADY